MSRLFTTLNCFLLVTYCSSQSGPHLFSGTTHLSTGQIGVLTTNAEAAIILPAMLADHEKGGWSAGAALRSGLSDLKELAVAVDIPLPWKDHLGAGIQYAGIEGYSEQRITLSYSRKLFEKLNAALLFDLNRNSADEYGDVYTPSWAVCFFAPLANEFSMSAFIYNPMGQITTVDLPSMARIGVRYQPSEKASFAVEAEKDWQHELKVKAGIYYRIHPGMALMWGVCTEPSMVHAGISWNIFQKMAVSGGWRYHSRLGSMLSASISQNNNR